MKYILLILIFFSSRLNAQELFVFTEPASNMAAKSIGFRLNNYLMREPGKNNYHLLPEIMVGLSKKIMVHGELFLSNRDNSFKYEGGSLYLKYRFFSIDDIHSHFRMAAYGSPSAFLPAWRQGNARDDRLGRRRDGHLGPAQGSRRDPVRVHRRGHPRRRRRGAGLSDR